MLRRMIVIMQLHHRFANLSRAFMRHYRQSLFGHVRFPSFF